MLTRLFVAALLLAIALDSFLTVFKSKGVPGNFNRLSPNQQYLFWLFEFLLALGLIIFSIREYSYWGIAISVASLIFAFFIYLILLRLLIGIRVRGGVNKEMDEIMRRTEEDS